MVEQRLLQRAHQVLQRPGAVGLHGALRPVGQKHHRDTVALLMNQMGQINAVHVRQGELNENQVKTAALQPGQQLLGRMEMGHGRGQFPGVGRVGLQQFQQLLVLLRNPAKCNMQHRNGPLSLCISDAFRQRTAHFGQEGSLR